LIVDGDGKRGLADGEVCIHLFVFLQVKRNNVVIGSKLVARSQRDYFGKGLHVLFPKKNFYMQMNF
jgi:hypothetical protein